jgi:hypothetical protein
MRDVVENKVTSEQQKYNEALASKRDVWVAACGGIEVPFEKNGRRWLYVYNPGQHCHGWLDLGQDVVFDCLPD